MNMFLIWILVGGATGLIASLLMSHMPAGVAGAIIIGILGGVSAGLVFSLLDLPISAGIFTNVGVAFGGSALLLGITQRLL
jgi:uncharacterized membrane protein YeaQ/YmgE (transglycosylase-associated protein family)